jgi:hypothetical protein
MEYLTDFPKIQCPFIRETFSVNKEQHKRNGRQLQLRKPEVYLVVNKINPGYEWVFDDPDTIAVEKLDGTNVKIKTEEGRLVALQNRKNVINPLLIMKGKSFIIEGVFQAIQKGYVEDNLEQAGEIIGPKLQGNPYNIANHIWYPFLKSVKHLKYRSFHEHDVNFKNLSDWFEHYLKSLFMAKQVGHDKAGFAEGVIFYNLRRKAENQTYMAKLRRDMFEWYYSDMIEIYDYPK